jgi:hypothetical protein
MQIINLKIRLLLHPNYNKCNLIANYQSIVFNIVNIHHK